MKGMKTHIILVGACIATAVSTIAIAGPKLTRKGYESPKYDVLQTDGKFELRTYAAIPIVRTETGAGADDRFMRLFRYIDRGNSSKKKIAMTTPVFMEGDRDGAMSFVIPSEIAANGAPRPTDAGVRLGSMDAGKFAVLRFKKKGSQTDGQAAQKATERLIAWISNQGLETAKGAEPILAYFDPPWTPAALRRNEVLIRLEK